jgi:regulator of protease activity HflC (stomatin/prohibitin superfamily)
MLDRSTADALAAATTELAAVEFDAQRGRIIAEAQATARDIVAEAERAAQDIVANAVKTPKLIARLMRLKRRRCAFKSGLRRRSPLQRISPRADA